MLYHRNFVDRMRELYPRGTRVEVVSLCNEEEHLKPGMKGTVVGVDDQPAPSGGLGQWQQPIPLNRERPLPGATPAGGIPRHGYAIKNTTNERRW